MIRFNGVEEPFRAETVSGLLARHDIEPRGIAVAIDGEVVRRSEWTSTLICDGAQIEVVTAVAGG
ncbi:MAG TPA: sulfur carrier protein ThiS [Acidimicrobiales bacterium]|nr:sulfur carrier protein ThiS [Acidimicrobiales bacterium]